MHQTSQQHLRKSIEGQKQIPGFGVVHPADPLERDIGKEDRQQICGEEYSCGHLSNLPVLMAEYADDIHAVGCHRIADGEMIFERDDPAKILTINLLTQIGENRQLVDGSINVVQYILSSLGGIFRKIIDDRKQVPFRSGAEDYGFHAEKGLPKIAVIASLDEYSGFSSAMRFFISVS